MENNLGDWRIEQPGENNQPQQPKQPQQDDFGILNTIGGYIPEPIKTGARLVAGPAARALEYGAGLPGNIEEMATGLISATTGAQPAMFPGPLDIVNYLTGGTKGGPMEMSGHFFPTSQDIKEKVTQRLTGEATLPKSKTEEKYQDYATDIAGLLSGNPKSLANIGKAVGLASLGTLVKEGVEKFSGSEGLGNVAKTGSLLLGNIPGVRSKITAMSKGLYDKVSKGAQGQQIRFGNIEHSLNQVIGDLKGRSFEGKKELLDILEEAKQGGSRSPISLENANKIYNDKVKQINEQYNKLYETHGISKDLVAAKDNALKAARKETKNLVQGNKFIDAPKAIKLEQDMNSYITKYMDDQKMMRDVVPTLQKVRRTIGRNIGTLDKQVPGIMNDYLQAKEIFKSTQAQWETSKWLNKHINIDRLNHPITKALIHVAGHSGNIPAVVKGITGAVGIKHLTNAVELAFRNKTARSLYLTAIQQGLLGNSKAANKAFQHFDKYLMDKMPQESEGDWRIES